MLEYYADRAGIRASVIVIGVAESFRRLDSSKDLELLQSIVDNDLEPAIKLSERTQADLEASFSKRSKPSPGRTVKTKRAAKKPIEAK
jgi:hypothetical protein